MSISTRFFFDSHLCAIDVYEKISLYEYDIHFYKTLSHWKSLGYHLDEIQKALLH